VYRSLSEINHIDTQISFDKNWFPRFKSEITSFWIWTLHWESGLGFSQTYDGRKGGFPHSRQLRGFLQDSPTSHHQIALQSLSGCALCSVCMAVMHRMKLLIDCTQDEWTGDCVQKKNMAYGTPCRSWLKLSLSHSQLPSQLYPHYKGKEVEWERSHLYLSANFLNNQ